MSKKLEDYSKEELIETIKHLQKRKKFGLVWDHKPEDVVDQCQKELPVLEHVEKNAVNSIPNAPTNLIIEGDNYHALSVLNYTHPRGVDAIYIDPPYNTGASDWKYNNNYVDAEDPYRHTKWISFMEHRLRLSKNLLAPDGIICVTIDDYEFPRLVMLMDEIFGEQNRLGTVVIRNNPQGRSTIKGFSINHEYALFYGRTPASRVGRLDRSDKQLERYPEIDEDGKTSERQDRTLFARIDQSNSTPFTFTKIKFDFPKWNGMKLKNLGQLMNIQAKMKWRFGP
jgi:adenine-specific DNA-methyltransferase